MPWPLVAALTIAKRARMDGAKRSQIRSYGEVATTQIVLERTIRKIAKARSVALEEMHICYEAGGCGMWIARLLVRLKVQCTVIAPSLIPSNVRRQGPSCKRPLQSRRFVRMESADGFASIRASASIRVSESLWIQQ